MLAFNYGLKRKKMKQISLRSLEDFAHEGGEDNNGNSKSNF